MDNIYSINTPKSKDLTGKRKALNLRFSQPTSHSEDRLLHLSQLQPESEFHSPRLPSHIIAQMRYYSARNATQRFLKRLFDFAFALTALTILSPFLLLVGILVKLSSPGPMLYTQQRMGRNKVPFTIYKYRSMRMHADRHGPNASKGRNNPAITPLGRLIRKTSIDELPQLWNVLIGDMSLVGPRPAIESEIISRGWHEDDFLRLAVPQGITCIWQVRGRSDLSFQQQMEMDRDYVMEWSLWLDFKLLVRTVWAVLSTKGAY